MSPPTCCTAQLQPCMRGLLGLQRHIQSTPDRVDPPCLQVVLRQGCLTNKTLDHRLLPDALYARSGMAWRMPPAATAQTTNLRLLAAGLHRAHEEDAGAAGARAADRLHHRQRPLRHVVADDEGALLDVEALLGDGGAEERVECAVAEARDDLALVRRAHQRVARLESACKAHSTASGWSVPAQFTQFSTSSCVMLLCVCFSAGPDPGEREEWGCPVHQRRKLSGFCGCTCRLKAPTE